MSSNAINLYIGNHNAASISDFVEFLSIESNDAGLRPVITHQLFPDTKNIVIECMLRKYARLRKFRRKRNK